MTHQDRISIIITFIIGMAVGSYLYFAGFLPTYHLPDMVADQGTYDSFVLIADAYGQCAVTNNCLSFQLLADRSYQAVIGDLSVSGDVSRSALRQLLSQVTRAELTRQSTSLPVPNCHYGGDEATNFRFVFTFEGVNYRLDTCESAIDYSGPLWQALRAVSREVAEGAS
jgi:hypothetical protein